MRLTLTTFLTLDGVMQGPGMPDEDTRGGFRHGGWQARLMDDETARLIAVWFDAADAFLLGRTTYELFAAYWPLVTDGRDPVAGPLNALPKYVVSSTLDKATWHNSTVLDGDPVAAVTELKSRPGRELQVHGSGRLARSLLANGLVDEYRMLIYPVVLGTGLRLFDEHSTAALRPLSITSTSKGVIVAVYEPAGRPSYGSFGPPGS